MKRLAIRFFCFCCCFLFLFSCSLATLAADDAGIGTDQQNYYTVTGQWGYTLVHEVTVSNEQDGAARNVVLSIPLMDDSVPVYYTLIREQLTPYPDSIISDDQGRRFAIYYIDRLEAGEQLVFYQKFAVSTSALRYHIDYTATNYDYDQIALLSNYLLPDEYSQSDDWEISQYVQNVIGQETNPYLIAKMLFAAVNLQVYYQESDLPQDAKSVLNRRTAYCEGYVNLLVALLRAAGIPARAQSGYLFQPEDQIVNLSSDTANGLQIDSLRHTWLEFYLPQIGWLFCDPSQIYTYSIDGVVNKFVNWDYFCQIPETSRYVYFRQGNGAEDKIDCSSIGSQLTVNITPYLMFGNQTSAFNDISGHWAEESVEYVAAKGYFAGVGNNLFAPDQGVTRGMFITVLGRMYEAGGSVIDETGRSNLFADVQADDYFAKYVAWGVSTGIIDGYGNGNFGPNDAISRQQMAKIIFAYMDYYYRSQGQTLLYSEDYLGILAVYSDTATIDEWALPGIAFCTEAALLTGMPDGTVAPRGTATRAQTAAILQRIDEYLAADLMN